MTLVFPTIPFSGSAATSFESAYRTLAQSIWDDIENLKVDVTPYSSFYKDKNVMKELLEHAVLYAAFIMQKRAGESGPGSDFNLGNTPALITESPELVRLFGCKFKSDCMRRAWFTNANEDPIKYQDILEFNSNSFNAMWDLIDAIIDGNFTDYMNTYSNLGVNRAGIQSALLNAWNVLTNNIPGIPVAYALSGNMLRKYLNGDGGSFTESDLSSGQLNSLRTDINSWLTQAQGKSYVDGSGNTIPHINDVTTPGLLSTYGANSGDRIVMVNFKYGSGDSLHTAFGRATLVLDSDGEVTRIVDDYDWYFAWSVDRSDGSQPGIPFSDSQIVVGSSRRQGSGLYDSNGNLNQIVGGITAEDAFSSGNTIESFLLFTVSGAYGNGAYNTWADHPNSSDSGKPFVVNIAFD